MVDILFHIRNAKSRTNIMMDVIVWGVIWCLFSSLETTFRMNHPERLLQLLTCNRVVWHELWHFHSEICIKDYECQVAGFPGRMKVMGVFTRCKTTGSVFHRWLLILWSHVEIEIECASERKIESINLDRKMNLIN